MFRPSRAEDDPGAWPLLQFLGTRTVLICGGRVYEEPGTPPFPPDLIQFAQDEELRAARSGGPGRPWPKAPPHPIWSQAAAAASRAGGLRVHDPFALGIQAQAFCQPEVPVPMLYLDETMPSVDLPSVPAITVWYNPSGEADLPQARQEALELHGLFAAALPGARFVGRALSKADARELLGESDVIAYLGHGRAMPGTVGVPCPDGIVAVGPAFREQVRDRVLIFGGCMERTAGPISLGGACAIVPFCRLADRPSPFLGDVVQHWTTGAGLTAAFRAALQADQARGDFRWRTFRYQGDSHWARIPLPYS